MLTPPCQLFYLPLLESLLSLLFQRYVVLTYLCAAPIIHTLTCA